MKHQKIFAISFVLLIIIPLLLAEMGGTGGGDGSEGSSTGGLPPPDSSGGSPPLIIPGETTVCDSSTTTCADEFVGPPLPSDPIDQQIPPYESNEQLFSPAPLTAPKVLHIGDSHTVGSYGRKVHEQFQSIGYSIHTFGCGGASANNYNLKNYKVCTTDTMNADGTVKNPKEAKSIVLKNNQKSNFLNQPPFDIQTEINEFQPNIIIISLGTNFLTEAGVVNQETAILNLLTIATANGKTCYWVGAPVTKSPKVHPTAINTNLKLLADQKGCHFIDAEKISDPTKLTSGKVHFQDATMWATGVVNQITGGMTNQLYLPIEDDIIEFNPNEKIEDLASFSPTQSLSSQTKNIDDAWLKFASLINPQLSNKVFLASKGWTDYSIAYPAPITSSQNPSTPGSQGPYNLNLKVLPEEQKTMVKAAVIAEGIAEKENIALKLLAAESSGNPNAISSTGCSGLMQICSISPVSDIIVHHCKQNRDVGPQMCGQYQDDRFNPQKSIQAGVRILKLNLKSTSTACPNANDQCGVAAYNIGAAVIKDAASKARADGKTDWNSIYKEITPDMLRSHRYTGDYWTEERLKKKITNLGPYVAKITSP